MSDAYTVAQDDAGCATCFHGRTYNIVGPDGVAFGQSWGDADEVAVLTDMLNDAFKKGQAARPTEAPWQPIDTAPKDWKFILLTNGLVVSLGGWMTDVEQGAEYEGQAGMAGWWSIESMDGKPTHWMPLPVAPHVSPSGDHSC